MVVKFLDHKNRELKQPDDSDGTENVKINRFN